MMPKGDVWRMWVAALLMFAAVMAVFAGLNRCAFGQEVKRPDDLRSAPSIMLFLTIITPGNRPNVMRQMPEPSLEKCWEDAQAFLAEGIPRNLANADGLEASCTANASALQTPTKVSAE